VSDGCQKRACGACAGSAVDRYVGVYEHQLLPGGREDTPWRIGRRRVLLDHSIEAAGGQVSILL
jgi:hypothetical protein